MKEKPGRARGKIFQKHQNTAFICRNIMRQCYWLNHGINTTSVGHSNSDIWLINLRLYCLLTNPICFPLGIPNLYHFSLKSKLSYGFSRCRRRTEQPQSGRTGKGKLQPQILWHGVPSSHTFFFYDLHKKKNRSKQLVIIPLNKLAELARESSP